MTQMTPITAFFITPQPRPRSTQENYQNVHNDQIHYIMSRNRDSMTQMTPQTSLDQSMTVYQ